MSQRTSLPATPAPGEPLIRKLDSVRSVKWIGSRWEPLCQECPLDKKNLAYRHGLCKRHQPPDPNGPDIGAVKHVNGRSYRYDGKSWQRLCDRCVSPRRKYAQVGGVCLSHLQENRAEKGQLRKRKGRKERFTGKKWVRVCSFSGCNRKVCSQDMCVDHTLSPTPRKGDTREHFGTRQRFNGTSWLRLCRLCDGPDENYATKNGLCTFHLKDSRNYSLEESFEERALAVLQTGTRLVFAAIASEARYLESQDRSLLRPLEQLECLPFLNTVVSQTGCPVEVQKENHEEESHCAELPRIEMDQMKVCSSSSIEEERDDNRENTCCASERLS